MATLTNPQSKRSGYARDTLDWYVEPAWCVDVLLDHAGPFAEPVWDPAAGMGTIPRRFRERGLSAFGSDVRARGYDIVEADFLDEDQVHKPLFFHGEPGAIVSNPPYGKATAFIRQALPLADNVAVLVRLDFLASRSRHHLFSAHPPALVIVLSKRPSMPPGEQLVENGESARGGGQHDYCWIVWRAGDHGQRLTFAMPTEGAAASEHGGAG